MSDPTAEIRFTNDHEWVRLDGDVVTVGITDHAQQALGDIVFVELPKTGRKVDANEACAVVESVKAASEIYAPVSGEVVEVNSDLESAPATVNEDPKGRGWFLKLRIKDASELQGLMTEDQYNDYVGTL